MLRVAQSCPDAHNGQEDIYVVVMQHKHYFAVNDDATVFKLTDIGENRLDEILSSPQNPQWILGFNIIMYAQNIRDDRFDVIHSRFITKIGASYLYEIKLELSDVILTNESRVRYQHPGSPVVTGTLISQNLDDSLLYIMFDNHITDAYEGCHLYVSQNELLKQLGRRIQLLKVWPEKFSLTSTNQQSVLAETSTKLSERLLLDRFCNTPFIWGPPGSGKTWAICDFIARALDGNIKLKVLLLGQSNKAIDVAMEQLVERLRVHRLSDMIENRKILRYGYTKSTMLLNQPELLGSYGQDELQYKIRDCFDRLKLREESNDVEEIAKARAEILVLQQRVKDAVAEHINSCNVVGTTTTLAFLGNSAIAQENHWNMVIVDEVTMVYPATCLYLSSLAMDRFYMAGDPRQLGPITEYKPGPNLRKWLEVDVFEHSGVTHAIDNPSAPNGKLIKVTKQRRCDESIWNRVRNLYPGVSSNISENDTREYVRNLFPHKGKSFTIIELPPTAVATRHAKSWKNEVSADLVIEILMRVSDSLSDDIDISIMVITPYRAQVQFIRAAYRIECKAERSPLRKLKHVEIGTVHQFQGSEADYVIFDLVKGPPETSLGILLSEKAGERLLNVAVTRAKSKFVIICNSKWCKEHTSETHLLRDMISDALPRTEVRIVEKDSSYVESELEKLFRAAFESVQGHEKYGMKEQYEIKDGNGVLITIADFAFPDRKIAIYCDGKRWHLGDAHIWEMDIRKRNTLTLLGWKFFVFTWKQLTQDAQKSVGVVLKLLDGKSHEGEK